MTTTDMTQTATLRLLSDLIAIPTVSRDSNLGLIEHVRDHLARFGVPVRLSYDGDRRKANLFATLGEGPKPGLVLSGHTDVVPVDGQDWSSDPFTAQIRDGRVYGRGSADMKGFIAVAVANTARILDARLDRPVHFALTYDEEVGCLGVRTLLADLASAGIKPSECIVGEPTGMRPVIGHKSLTGWRCRIRGREAHSSLTPQAVNAIEYAARLIVHIRALAARLRDSEVRQVGYDVPYSTINIGQIGGGIAMNVVPRDCSFDFEARCLPGTDPDDLIRAIRRHADTELLPEMREIAAEAAIEFERIVELPAFRISPDEALPTYARQLLDQLRSAGGIDDGERCVAFGTEAGFFQQAGVASLVCGPGAIAQAHRPDEYVELRQLADCERFIEALVGRMSSPA